MNILLISQCDKRALTETRRIIDQFAERRGDRTWQTPITQDGLDTLSRLLRKTARKNTAVACHWIRGRDHTELKWIVGDARRFNAEGAVPTNSTARNILRAQDENTWHSLPWMQAMTALAALLHDLGKATDAFQTMLGSALHTRFDAKARPTPTHYRHEWVSVRLFQAFVGQDDDATWLQRLIDAVEREDMQAWLAEWLAEDRLQCDGMPLRPGTHAPDAPFSTLPPLACAVAWLVLTHHRLPALRVPRRPMKDEDSEDIDHPRDPFLRYGAKAPPLNADDLHGLLQRVDADWNEPPRDRSNVDLAAYWRFPHGLPVTTMPWRKQAARVARKLLTMPAAAAGRSWLHDPFVMHVSRLCLMLADHYYSSLTKQRIAGGDALAAWLPVPERRPYLQPDAGMYANTARCGGNLQINQTLEEHLLGVQANASHVAHALPTLTRSLPALQRHRGLSKRSRHEEFRWQDKAADLASAIRERAAEHGAFIVNMASTGCGKTLGNARIMHALANPSHGMRCAFAIGLRTLTQQTGRSFQRDLTLGDDELAILVGGSASRALFSHYEARAEATGSASRQALIEEDSHVLYEGDDRHPLLQRFTADARTRRLIAAPVLVCTVDHLTPATESLRGGRQIAPMLRLMTGDLVLDEPDDFDLADLPALTRLVHWAGLLGSRVLLSSATLPPALVQGLYEAYRDGRLHWKRNRSEQPNETPRIACLWVDEFKQSQADCAEVATFKDAHDAFIKTREERLTKATVRRIAQLHPVAFDTSDKAERRRQWAVLLRDAALQLHGDPQNHVIDPDSGKRVSFGLIRMANIAPLFDTALALFQQGAPNGMRIHLCVYHSQHPLLMRSAIEYRLDTVLDRRRGQAAPEPVFARPQVREAIDAYPETDHLFIVLGSPVTEVGRDHDYDWAVVEPSSMRSLIQLAGRVRRHRPEPITAPNVFVLDTNLRVFERRDIDEAAYCRPGFEMDKLPDGRSSEEKARQPNFHLRSHRLGDLLSDLMDADGCWPLDARPRLRLPEGRPVDPTRKLIDLEHARLRHAMRPDLHRRPGTPSATSPTTDWMINASTHWNGPQMWLSGVLPQTQRFRDDPMPRVEVVMLPDDDEEALRLHRVTDGDRRGESAYAVISSQCSTLPDSAVNGPGIAPWGQDDLLTLLAELAEQRGESLRECAESFTTASLPRSERGWQFHPVLGFNKEGI